MKKISHNCGGGYQFVVEFACFHAFVAGSSRHGFLEKLFQKHYNSFKECQTVSGSILITSQSLLKISTVTYTGSGNKKKIYGPCCLEKVCVQEHDKGEN